MSKDRTYREQTIRGNLSAANCWPLVLNSIENHHQPIDRAGEGAEIQRIDPDRWREIGDPAGCGSPPRVGEIGQRPRDENADDADDEKPHRAPLSWRAVRGRLPGRLTRRPAPPIQAILLPNRRGLKKSWQPKSR